MSKSRGHRELQVTIEFHQEMQLITFHLYYSVGPLSIFVLPLSRPRHKGSWRLHNGNEKEDEAALSDSDVADVIRAPPRRL